MDKKLYSLITQSSHYRPGDMEGLFKLFKSRDGKTSYEELLSGLKIDPGMKILELPSGSAPLSKLLLQNSGGEIEVIAVDFNQKELDRITDKRVQKKCEPAQKLSLDSDSIDFVFCHLGIMLFNPLQDALTEISRVLVSDGQLVANIIDFNGSNVLKTFSSTSGKYLQHVSEFPGWGDPRGNDRIGLEQALGKAGFKVPSKASQYSVSLKGRPKEVIDSARVFFQVNFMLDENLRNRYIEELVSRLESQADQQGFIELEIPFQRLIATKFPTKND